MFILIEYSNENYIEMISESKKLDLTPVFLFKLDLANKDEIKSNLIKIKEIKTKINLKYSAIQIYLPEKQENSLIGTINSLKNDFDILIGFGGLNKINRFFLEETKIDFLQDPQNSIINPKIDFIHHFNSGINDILSQFAKRGKIGFLFDLNFINLKTKYMSKEFGRINQNILFARKYKIPIYLNFIIKNSSQLKSKEEIRAILHQFDLNTLQIKTSLDILEKKIEENIFKKSQNYITDGIKIK